MAFVFWKNVASHYERDLLRSIALVSGSEVVCAIEQDLPADRIALGWGAESFEPVRLVRSDDPFTFEALVARKYDTHVMTGFLYHSVLSDAFSHLAKSGARVVFHSESVETGGIKGALRFARDRVKAARFAGKAAGVLAIGDLGVNYFESLGFGRSRIIPFGYFVDPRSCVTDSVISRPGEASFRIVYAGQFIARKGLELLFASLGRMAEMNWTLEMIGRGPQESPLKAAASQLGISGKIVWRGALPPERIPEALEGADLLVLPSRWDGWGVVVNEALAAGVPVVCSDRCGAACVLAHPAIGEVFRTGDVDALASLLRRRVGTGSTSSETRVACREAARRLSPESGARQFLDGIAALGSGSPPPPAPWLREPGSPVVQHS